VHGGCKANKKAGLKVAFPFVRPAFACGSPEWTRTGTATRRSWASSSTSPEWLSLQQAAIVYGVSVDSLCRRNRPRRASRIGGRLIRVRVRVDDLDRLFRPIPTGRPPLRKAW
jgi:hypothetical protein